METHPPERSFRFSFVQERDEAATDASCFTPDHLSIVNHFSSFALKIKAPNILSRPVGNLENVNKIGIKKSSFQNLNENENIFILLHF